MEPVAVVTAILAVLYILGRGGFVIAPEETAAFHRRWIARPAQVRTFGSLLGLIAVSLIITAPQARQAHHDIAIGLECLGWIAAAAAVYAILAPRSYRRVADWFLGASAPVLRLRGVLSVAFGLFLGWVSIFVL